MFNIFIYNYLSLFSSLFVIVRSLKKVHKCCDIAEYLHADKVPTMRDKTSFYDCPSCIVRAPRIEVSKFYFDINLRYYTNNMLLYVCIAILCKFTMQDHTPYEHNLPYYKTQVFK